MANTYLKLQEEKTLLLYLKVSKYHSSYLVSVEVSKAMN